MLNFLCTDNYLCFDKMKDITTMDSTFATKKKKHYSLKKNKIKKYAVVLKAFQRNFIWRKATVYIEK